jgi:predicted PurR-regulated permease PerM
MEPIAADLDTATTPTQSPRTVNVLVLLAVVAAVFSYLGAYAGTNALLKAELIEKWPPGHDPRPKWMLIGFVGMLAALLIVGVLLRWSSNRQLRRLDAMEDNETTEAKA